MTGKTDIRVLLVSPRGAVAQEVREALLAGDADAFVLSVVASAREAVVALRRLPSDVTLVDVADGAAGALHELRLVCSTTADTAIVAVADSPRNDLAAAVFACGAQDALVRRTDDLTPDRLARAIRHSLARSAHDTSRPLATMVELSSDAIITLNREWLVTRFNAAAERLYGWHAAEVLGQPAALLTADGDRDGPAAFLERVLGGQSITAVETPLTMRDGRRRIVSVSGSPIVDALGDVLEACLILRDVTEEVTARLRLAEQRHLFESSQAAGHVGSWAIDRLTGRIEWSAEQYRLLQRDPSDGPATLGELLDLVHPDDRATVRDSFRGDAPFAFEARFLAGAPEARTLRVRGEYLPREDGAPGRLLGITQDVTEERAERAAREAAEERLRRGFEEALIGMVILGMDGRPQYVNHAMGQIFGLTRAELLARPFLELTHPDDRDDDAPALEVLLAGPSRHLIRERRYIHADGHTIWAEVGLSLITHADGTPSHIVGQIQDITERRAHVELLRHMADQDPLTGLLNRRAFHRELNAHLARGRRYGASGALLMLDLDGFKHHNDSHGHGAGDDLLCAVADCLRSRLRATDVIGRLGGDEFAALLPQTDRGHAMLLAGSLLEHIGGIVTAAGEPAQRVTASVGMVGLDRLERLTPEHVLRAADRAMYEAKRQGRNRAAEWGPTLGRLTPASD